MKPSNISKAIDDLDEANACIIEAQDLLMGVIKLGPPTFLANDIRKVYRDLSRTYKEIEKLMLTFEGPDVED